MNTHGKSADTLADAPINVKLKLSAFWVTLMLFYIYADILGFYTPGNIEKVISGEIGGIQISDSFLFIMAVWMAIPTVMVFLSLTLKANVNRWANIVVGCVSLIILVATFFAGEISARYTFQAVIEAVLMVLIVWHAWNWPGREEGEAA